MMDTEIRLKAICLSSSQRQASGWQEGGGVGRVGILGMGLIQFCKGPSLASSLSTLALC